MARVRGVDISLQTLKATASRRAREAEALLDHPAGVRRRDGAVTCALLAAECALKAVLLRGRRANTVADLPDDVRERCFAGAAGHRLRILWDTLEAADKDPGDAGYPSLWDAVTKLNQLDRYAHRYGQRTPDRSHAEPHVESARVIINWMEARP